MNKARRKMIANIIERLEDIHSDIEFVRDEEQDAFDNLPESLQGSERGEQMEEYVDTLDELHDAVGDVIDSLWDIANG